MKVYINGQNFHLKLKLQVTVNHRDTLSETESQTYYKDDWNENGIRLSDSG